MSMEIQQLEYVAEMAELTPGSTVRVHQKITEGSKTRVQIFEGLIIGRNGRKGVSASIKVRRIAVGNVGVERIFPLYSPTIEKIEVVKRAKVVRRAKLNYLRKIKGDAFNFQEVPVRKFVTIHKPKTAEIEEVAA